MARSNYELILYLLIFSVVFIPMGKADTLQVATGRVESFVFDESKIFPGTVRQVSVYIPAQLDYTKPACVYVQQDGLDKRNVFPAILDILIARKEIPALVGVFVTPGKLVPPNEKDLRRTNRSFEYDGLGDDYVRFLLEEILPVVAKKYNLNLSNSGNDRAIGGASSGDIAAFNAAWERPDAFSRVYCNSGSFVAFRGGHEYPVLVRKTEPKPIRSFLTVGTKDLENYAGDWPLINMDMEKALKFSGYEYQFHLLEGGHVVGYEEYFDEAMRYLWKGWPEVVKAGPGGPRYQDIVLPSEGWQLVSEGFGDARGPSGNSKGEVFFADPPNNKIHKISLDGNITGFVTDVDKPLALSVGPSGELFAVSASGKIVSYDASGRGTLYAEGVHGQYILALPKGGVYVSAAPGNEGRHSKVWRVEKGKNPTVVDEGLKSAAGLAMTPDHWLLAVADRQSHWVYSYEITKDGKLNNKERYFWLHVQDWEDDSGAESMCYDREGHLYVATRYGIQICTENGSTQVILPVPGGKVTGVCLGGPDKDILFAFCGDRIYKRKVKTHAVGAFTPWIRMTKGKL
jgi:enterochelin esterase-like enzyme/sugar lactone lactonase YvrE